MLFDILFYLIHFNLKPSIKFLPNLGDSHPIANVSIVQQFGQISPYEEFVFIEEIIDVRITG